MNRPLARFLAWIPPVSAGFIAVLVGFTSSVALVFQAAQAAGATPEITATWIAALCLGMGATSIAFSLYYKIPVLTAWSTPGAALLAVSLTSAQPLSDVLGAFLFSGILITIAGASGWFEKLIDRIPASIASALLAGILFRFGTEVFVSLKTSPSLVLPMLGTYLAFKRWLPRYAVMGVLAIGLAACYVYQPPHFETVTFKWIDPVFTMPSFSGSAIVSLGLPLFIVTMASQNLSGVAAIRSFGYPTPLSPVITGTGITTMILAPFGVFGINLAAITAAICMGPEAHENKNQRYWAAVFAGIFYLLVGLVGGVVGDFLHALPAAFVFSLAGIALFSTISTSLHQATQDERSREAAILTFLITASNVTLAGIGAAFWGIVLGSIALLIFRRKAS